MRLFKTLGPVLFSLGMNIAFYTMIIRDGIEDSLPMWIFGGILLGASFIAFCYHGYKTYNKSW